ncbi:hypothetical protein FE257_004541 [Aspergillus nanangensis]|uniref:C2H2-type domain-containing protein n=1 Tax=Aspergillus nanangensis TaxID=2582783 RepID=A0AAD4CY73_ASPNN|nr:hypothetical protein FE257_004541 [Aspergillus nanangensis]
MDLEKVSNSSFSNEAEPESVKSIVPISSTLSICFHELHSLLELTRSRDNNEDDSETLQHEIGRLRVWAGNFGAHRKPTDRLSLDHRLREAQELHLEVRNHFSDITKAAKDADNIEVSDLFSGHVHHLQDSDESTVSDDSESDDFWAQLQEEDEVSETKELLLDISHAVTSLYKFSLTLQNPASRDRSKQAARIPLQHYAAYDIQHVANKFGLPQDDPLAQRLGKANTTRRQILAYHKDHSGKISKYIDVAVNKAVMLSDDQPVKRNVVINNGSRTAKSTASTHWTQNTTASTIREVNCEVASDSGRTIFSSASSTAEFQQMILTIPPPPGHEKASDGVPFLCPYCCQMIQLENTDDDWRYHVYGDLRPYICTFGNCVQSSQLYDSYREWSDHERQFHRREWACHICTAVFDTRSSFNDHLQDIHHDMIPKDQVQTIATMSNRPVTSPQQCPLCPKPPIADLNRFQQHLARHLQQLSLFVLPRPDDSHEHEETDSKQNVFDNESREGLLLYDNSNVSFTSLHRASTTSAKSEPVATVETAVPMRGLQAAEQSVVNAFQRHANRCVHCANPFIERKQGVFLCERDVQYAINLADFLYTEHGKIYSVIDRLNFSPSEVDLPTSYTAPRLLLKAIENGLSLDTGRVSRRDFDKSPDDLPSSHIKQDGPLDGAMAYTAKDEPILPPDKLIEEDIWGHDAKTDLDTILLRHRRNTYELLFPAYAIDEGRLRVGQLRQRAAEVTQTSDPKRIRLLYKGNVLDDDTLPCCNEGLRPQSEVLCVVSGIQSGQRTPSDPDSDLESNKNSDSSQKPNVYEARKRHRMRNMKKKIQEQRAEDELFPLVEPPPPSAPNLKLFTTPIAQSHALMSYFQEVLSPLCEEYIANPPAESKARDFEFKKLSETILAQVLLRVNGIDPETDEERLARRTLIKEAQKTLGRLEAARDRSSDETEKGKGPEGIRVLPPPRPLARDEQVYMARTESEHLTIQARRGRPTEVPDERVVRVERRGRPVVSVARIHDKKQLDQQADQEDNLDYTDDLDETGSFSAEPNILSTKRRSEILEAHLRRARLGPDISIPRLVDLTSQFMHFDLVQLCQKARFEAGADDEHPGFEVLLRLRHFVQAANAIIKSPGTDGPRKPTFERFLARCQEEVDKQAATKSGTERYLTEQERMDMELYLTATGKAVPIQDIYYPREHKRRESELSQITINTEARGILKDLFPGIPNHDLLQIIKAAFQK